MNRRRQTPRRALLVVSIASLVAAIVPATPALAADPVDVVFAFTGAEQSWAVPANVSSIHVVLIGGRGGSGKVAGGQAARVEGDITVTPGSTLYVEVGGNGAVRNFFVPGLTAGFNGGGAAPGNGTLPENDSAGGGGASDLRTLARTAPGTLGSRVVVAAGGGGGGVGNGALGIGGNAGAAGSNYGGTQGGQPGTQSAGGAGGQNPICFLPGADGALGLGGDGAVDGGGGGGGYYGGGGGAACNSSGSGGGGGSSFTANVTNASVTLAGAQATPSITITYTPSDAPDPTPDPTSEPPSGSSEVAFAPTDAEQQWTVPSGVTSIHVELIGAKGAGGSGFAGGFGHNVSGDLAVSPGTVLYIEVGGKGTAGAGGFNGGGAPGLDPSGGRGGGGGATDIRTVSRADGGSLASRLMVAGGGGGVGYQSTGGDAGGPGSGGALGGSPGTGGSGGAGGVGDQPGAPGALGIGGTGGSWCNGDICGSGTAGGAGGGGYYGGGGGGATNVDGGVIPSGAGGGGSAYTGSATNASVSVETEFDAAVTISWGGGSPDPTSGPDEGVVDATISMAESSICIELSTAAVDFGTGQFGQVDVPGSPDIVVTNCGISTQALYARATNATAPGASWDLVTGTASCADTLGLDEYHLRLIDAETLDDEWGLGTTNTSLQGLGVGSSGSYAPSIDTACPGSSGAGLQMSMQIVFTATENTP